MVVLWRFLNTDRIEVSPEYREHAWKELVVQTLQTCPKYNSYRTSINKANFEYFDYKRPLVYEIKNQNLLINNEFLNVALNRPNATVRPMILMPAHLLMGFICAILLSVVAAFVFDATPPRRDDNLDDNDD